jgi:5-methylcytosine-specific restriction enzyme subunit McrC
LPRRGFYQLFAYLKSAAADPLFVGCEGMLLYPMNGMALCETYRIQGHPITVATIDLAQPWPASADNLLSLIKPVVK